MRVGYTFDFEHLDVYKLAMEFVEEIFDATSRVPSQLQFSLGDQFRRAPLSIVNNIAEGSGADSRADKKRYYGYALNSARECIPMITVSLKRNVMTAEQETQMRQKCHRICMMLVKLIASTK